MSTCIRRLLPGVLCLLVVVFDALGTPALGYCLLQRIREVTDQPVERIVISHYHADHIYGLQAFKEHA